MKRITIFTPTYNRANLIIKGYKALCQQTSHDCKWLIIDDGSIDNTKELCKSWLISDTIHLFKDGFEGYSKDSPWLTIRYCHKENG